MSQIQKVSCLATTRTNVPNVLWFSLSADKCPNVINQSAVCTRDHTVVQSATNFWHNYVTPDNVSQWEWRVPDMYIGACQHCKVQQSYTCKLILVQTWCVYIQHAMSVCDVTIQPYICTRIGLGYPITSSDSEWVIPSPNCLFSFIRSTSTTSTYNAILVPV